MNDHELIAQIKNGNIRVLRFLVDKHKNLVWHIVLRMTNKHEDAEDLCQDIFLRVLKDIKNFRGESKLSTWIGSVAYNVCVDHLRKKSREKIISANDFRPLALEKISMETSIGTTDKEAIKKIVHQVIGMLPVNYRIVITLFHLEDCSYKEIASITGMPEGTVKSYISRAREMIREAVLRIVPDIQMVLFEHNF